MESSMLSLNTSTKSMVCVNSHASPLNRGLFNSRPNQLFQFQFTRLDRNVDPRRYQLKCTSSSVVSFASGGEDYSGGNSGGGGGGGGGSGDGAAEGGDVKPRAVVSEVADDSDLSSDVIVLEVRGMTCKGCAGKVKRILESQPQVSSALVNLETETATVWPVSEAQVEPNWQNDVGEALAKILTSCGFISNLRDKGDLEGDIQS